MASRATKGGGRKRHPAAPPPRKRGRQINFSAQEIGETSERGKPIVLCGSCGKNGEKQVWRGGEVIITHRGLEQDDGRVKMTEFCYLGVGERYVNEIRETSADTIAVEHSGESEAPKRKRGRPKGSKNKPKGEVPDGGQSPVAPKRRGRPPGSGKAKG